MLARADAVGFVEAAIPGLARMANLSIKETEAALEELMAPDPYSKSPAAEGRRVVAAPGGWCLINYEAYRARRNDEDRKEYMRKYMAERRKQSVNSVNNSKPQLAQEEEEEEEEEEGEREVKTLTRDEKICIFLKAQGALTEKDGKSLLVEWKGVLKGCKEVFIKEVFASAKPGILWPSEFKQHRAARSTY